MQCESVLLHLEHCDKNIIEAGMPQPHASDQTRVRTLLEVLLGAGTV